MATMDTMEPIDAFSAVVNRLTAIYNSNIEKKPYKITYKDVDTLLKGIKIRNSIIINFRKIKKELDKVQIEIENIEEDEEDDEDIENDSEEDDEEDEITKKNNKMWQDRRDKFRSERYKKEWIFAYVKKFIHLFPKIMTHQQALENGQKNHKARMECDEAFKDTYQGKEVAAANRGERQPIETRCINIWIDAHSNEYHNHYNPWYPWRDKPHSDKEINKLIDQNEFGLELGVTRSTNLWNGFMSKTFNMDSMGSEDHLVREMYNPTDQLVWCKTVCGKTIEFKMEL